MKRLGRSLATLALLSCCGCAIYTPYAVERHKFDWNSERQVNFQIEKFDHLPPKVIRVRMMRWAYNIGPAGECPKPLPRSWGGRVIGAPEMNGPRAMWNDVPPGQLAPDAMSPPVPHQLLPLIPPAPPADLSDPSGEFGPQGGREGNGDANLQPAGHQSSQRPRNSAGRSVSNAGWMFSAP